MRKLQIYFSEGANAVINWTYCKANVSNIFGCFVFRDFLKHKRKPFHLLSMDFNNGKVFNKGNKELNIKGERVDIKGNDHLVSFTMKNVSTHDSGYYRLEIQRHKYGDLENRVQIIVNSSGKYSRLICIYSMLLIN